MTYTHIDPLIIGRLAARDALLAARLHQPEGGSNSFSRVLADRAQRYVNAAKELAK